MESLLFKDTMTFSKFTLIPVDLETIPDLKNLNASSKSKLEKDLRSSNCWHRSQACQLEKDCSIFESTFGSKHDVTIGRFLKERYVRVAEMFSTASRRHQSHVDFLLTGNNYIKLQSSFEKKDNKSDRKDSFFTNTLKGLMSNSSINTTFTSGTKRTSLSQKTIKSFKMYLQCSKCLNKLSEAVELEKNFLEYSFTRYLDSLARDACEQKDHSTKQSFNQSSSDDASTNFDTIAQNMLLRDSLRGLSIRPCCVNLPKKRVFLVDDVSIKVEVGHFNSYSFSFIDYKDSRSTELVEMAEHTLTVQKKINFNEVQRAYLSISIQNIMKLIYRLIEELELDLDLTAEGLHAKEAAKIDEVSQVQNPYQGLESNIMVVYQKMSVLLEEVDVSLERKANHHLDVDLWRKEFYGQIEKVTSIVEVVVDCYRSIVDQGLIGALKREVSKLYHQSELLSPSTADSISGRGIDWDDCSDKTKTFEEASFAKNFGDKSSNQFPQTQDLQEELALIKKLTTGISVHYENFEAPESIYYVRSHSFILLLT